MSDELHLFADVEADATDGAYRYDPRSRTVRLNAVVTDGPADAVGRWVHVDVTPALLAEIVAVVVAQATDPAVAVGERAPDPGAGT